MPLADVFSLLVLGQGKSGLDVARWALARKRRYRVWRRHL